HKVFALSKDKIENQRSFLSLFDELPRRRLEIRFGKFSVPDFFDANSVGSDTHFQFDNWTVDNNGAWDYAADTRGYTVGVVADYEDRTWGLRRELGIRTAPRRRTEKSRRRSPARLHELCQHGHLPQRGRSVSGWLGLC